MHLVHNATQYTDIRYNYSHYILLNDILHWDIQHDDI